MQTQNTPVEVQVPKTADDFNALAKRILAEPDLERIHVLADALAVGVTEGNVFIAEVDDEGGES